jgi:hypothetical protein
MSDQRPLEETPEAAAAVDDETTVPQLVTGGGPDVDTPEFVEPAPEDDAAPADDNFEPRTGAEQPWDPEDLAEAEGHDPTRAAVEHARRELEELGPAAIEKTVP